MKKSIAAALSVAVLGVMSIIPAGKASAADPFECEILAGALCSAFYVEGSPSWKACVLDYIQRNCSAHVAAHEVDAASLRLVGVKPE